MKNITSNFYDISFSSAKINGSLILTDSVEQICFRAFYECSDLTGPLEIPSSVKSIGNYAFYKCSKFESLTISPNTGTTSIGDSAFYECSGFKGSLTIP